MRLNGAFTAKFAGCATIAQIKVYIESDSSAAKNSIDLDDFRLIDVTAGVGGTGGATGAGGASGVGGVTSAGGNLGTGGEAPDSGADTDGGTELDAG